MRRLALLAFLCLVACVLSPVAVSAAIAPPSFSSDTLQYGVITDPAATEGRSHVYGYDLGNTTQAVTWHLVDDGGATVIAPVSLGTQGSGHHEFTFDPTAAHGGTALPDGTYRIVLTATAGGESASVPQEVQLAQDPPRETTLPIHEEQRDVRPGWVKPSGTRETDYSHVSVTTGLPGGFFPPEFAETEGTFRVRTVGGTLVRQLHVTGECLGDCWVNYRLPMEWDGTDAAGRVQPAGEYALSVTSDDKWGRPTTFAIGSVWIQHLVNRRLTVRFEPVVARYAGFSVTGRCSQVTYPGPHRWASSAGLLSNSRCASRRGTADQVFKTFLLNQRDSSASRVMSVRVDAYGVPMRPRQQATLVLATGIRTPAWRRVAVLGQGLRWHNGTTWRPRPEPTHGALGAMVQGRVTNGNRYDLKFLRATWTYRDWTR